MGFATRGCAWPICSAWPLFSAWPLLFFIPIVTCWCYRRWPRGCTRTLCFLPNVTPCRYSRRPPGSARRDGGWGRGERGRFGWHARDIEEGHRVPKFSRGIGLGGLRDFLLHTQKTNQPTIKQKHTINRESKRTQTATHARTHTHTHTHTHIHTHTNGEYLCCCGTYNCLTNVRRSERQQ